MFHQVLLSYTNKKNGIRYNIVAEEPQAPILVIPIPDQIVNEGANFGPFNLNEYIESPDAVSGTMRFFAELSDGRALPQGLICTSDGWVSGIPANGTEGVYEIVVVAENASGIPLSVSFQLIIKERIKMGHISEFTQLKSKIWEALEQGLPTPEITELINHPITKDDINYLVERMAPFIIWDVFNLDPPHVKQLLNFENLNKHYNIYDCGSCLVGAPKELFSHERTMEDAYQMARVMAREVYKRGWTVEFSGIEKVKRVAWVELSHLSEEFGKKVTIISHTATQRDIQLYRDTVEAWKQANVQSGSKLM